jgi:anti-sigma factor RsiW
MTSHEHDATCRELAERVSEYLDGELPADLARAVETHFAACARCEAFLRSLSRVRALGAWLPPVNLEPEVLERLRKRMGDDTEERA